jgi:hypothetical protein
VGVLALDFDIRAEVRTIFSRLCENGELIAFIDPQRRVILSNDRVLLPAGYPLALKPGSSSLRLAGVQYIMVHRCAAPYQSYEGPGWTAVALVVAESAFEASSKDARVTFSGENIFSSRLKAIPEQARNIQLRLDRMVWNGQIQQVGQSNTFSRSLLDEVASTGRKTKDVFERSSAELLSMVASSLLDESRFLASLAVDILDRNLYERANDCRWWATSPILKTLDHAACQSTLQYINSLYTVYDNLLLIDANACVIASSRAPEWIDQTLTFSWVGQCLSLRSPQHYIVSPFEATALYKQQGTYVFACPILDDKRTIGAMVLVFDAKPQFKAMLDAVLPKPAGAMAVFCRPNGQIISQTADIPIPLPAHALQLRPGEKWSSVITQNAQCYSVGAACGQGYREFKTSDGYHEPIVAMIIVPCGQEIANPINVQGRMKPAANGTEIATFYVGEQLLGVPARDVLECIEINQSVYAPSSTTPSRIGFSTWHGKSLPLIDLGMEIGNTMTHPSPRNALIVTSGDHHIGLLITGLGPVVDMQLYNTPLGNVRLCTRVGQAGDVVVPILSTADVF